MEEQFFSPCPRGLEAVLASELESLGANKIAVTGSGVAYSGAFTLCYRVNLESRIASRVLREVRQCHYRSEQDIYQAARTLDWPAWFDVTRSIMVELNARNCPLKSLDFLTLRIKDAVCDRFRDAIGQRPNVDTRAPDIRIHAFVTEDTLTLYLDTSGEPLFKRGYRDARVNAPLKENLAAGILRLTGWKSGEPLYDPMCGSGTFLIEAAMMTQEIAPGLGRSFAFEKFIGHKSADWESMRRAAQARRKPFGTIFGSDKYGEALKTARANLMQAGLAEIVQLKQVDVLEMSAPAAAGVMVMNPPYGVRLSAAEDLSALYPRLGDVLKRKFAGWRAYIFTADKQLPKLIRLSASKRTPLFNGALECRLYEYRLQAGSMRKEKPAV